MIWSKVKIVFQRNGLFPFYEYTHRNPGLLYLVSYLFLKALKYLYLPLVFLFFFFLIILFFNFSKIAFKSQRGQEESHDWVGRGGEGGGGKVEAGWDQLPWGVPGGGEGFPRWEGPTHGTAISRDGKRPSENGGSEGNTATISPDCSGHGEPAVILGLNLSPLGSPSIPAESQARPARRFPATQVLSLSTTTPGPFPAHRFWA